MKCNNCSVNIEYKTDTCPICGKKINTDSLPDLFPKPTQLTNKKPNKISFKFMVLIFVLSISLILLIINVFTFKNSPWALISTVALLLTYILCFYSFNKKYSLACRNTFTFSAVLAMFYFIGYLAEFLKATTFYILPTIFIIFTLINFIALIILDKKKYFFSTIFFGLIGFLPLILCAFNLPISIFIAIPCSIISSLSLITALLINKNNLSILFRSFFHF